MKTVLMAVAVIKKDDQILIRKFDPAKNPYREPWGLFGGRLEGDGDVTEALNRELQERWNMTVSIDKRVGWDQEQKVDHDDEEKRFIYLDALCNLEAGNPQSTNPNEELKWVGVTDLHNYELNPPSAKLLKELGFIS
ncbi:MAG TPA: NUDIX domain-containing protein [Candidatus Saccharimonadales bacterium]|nr:NUDIX domain-containing protein [Candidatus Saccharimonadales bacterium]